MPRIKDRLLCRAFVAAKDGPCLAPATRDGHPDCEHGKVSRAWVAKFAPKVTSQ